MEALHLTHAGEIFLRSEREQRVQIRPRERSPTFVLERIRQEVAANDSCRGRAQAPHRLRMD